MNAFELYEAAFDTANDQAEATAEYVNQYASGAFDLYVPQDVCEKIAAARRAYQGADSENGEYEQAYAVHVRRPLESIEL